MNKDEIPIESSKDSIDAICKDSTYAIYSLVNDLAIPSLSFYGKKILIYRLQSLIEDHKSNVDKLVQELLAYKEQYNALKDAFDKIKDPEKDFRVIAKQLNFPDVKATSNGSAINPNIEMPFEDPVPKKDIDFMKNYLPKKTLDEVVIPKEEQLSKKEIAMYTDVDKALVEDNKAKHSIKDIAKLNKTSAVKLNKINKTKCQKTNFKRIKKGTKNN